MEKKKGIEGYNFISENKVKENKNKKNRKATKPNKKKTVSFKRVVVGFLTVLFFSAVFSLLLFSSAVYAYKEKYTDRAMFGTKLLGEDMGGKTKEEIQKILEKKLSQINFTFTVDDQVITVKPEKAGITFETGNTAGKAFSVGKNGTWYRPWMHAAASLIYRVNPSWGESLDRDVRENLSMKYKIDDKKLAEFTRNLSTKFNIESKNAGLVMKGTDVQVIPAVAGRKIVADSVKMQVAEALKSVRTSTIKIDVEKVNPDIIEEDTKEAITGAKKMIELPVVYQYDGKKFVPDKTTIASWVVFNTKKEGKKSRLVPKIDVNRAYSYVYDIASKINIPAINKKVTIENGGKQKVTREGKNGLAVDIDRVVQTTASSLSSGKGVDLVLPTYIVKYKTQINNIIVANWAKYIEINISTQRMTAYASGGKVVGTWAVTTGKNGTATPTGTFLVVGKSAVTRMTGGTPGYDYYDLPNVHWVTWFRGGGYSIHEAYWRSSFGGQDYKWNGSHGCVNATYSTADFIYHWAPVGTPVVVHY